MTRKNNQNDEKISTTSLTVEHSIRIFEDRHDNNALPSELSNDQKERLTDPLFLSFFLSDIFSAMTIEVSDLLDLTPGQLCFFIFYSKVVANERLDQQLFQPKTLELKVFQSLSPELANLASISTIDGHIPDKEVESLMDATEIELDPIMQKFTHQGWSWGGESASSAYSRYFQTLASLPGENIEKVVRALSNISLDLIPRYAEGGQAMINAYGELGLDVTAMVNLTDTAYMVLCEMLDKRFLQDQRI